MGSEANGEGEVNDNGYVVRGEGSLGAPVGGGQKVRGGQGDVRRGVGAGHRDASRSVVVEWGEVRVVDVLGQGVAAGVIEG